MKSNFKYVLWAALIALVMVSCGKEDIPAVVTKNVVYEVKKNNPQADTEELFIVGEFLGKNGLAFNLQDRIDWKLTLTDVPADVKVGFNGYLRGENIKKIDVTISMIVTDAKTGRVLQNDKKVVTSVKDLASGTGFTLGDLKQKTEFSFKE